jgi:hypothetical protein
MTLLTRFLSILLGVSYCSCSTDSMNLGAGDFGVRQLAAAFFRRKVASGGHWSKLKRKKAAVRRLTDRIPKRVKRLQTLIF